VSAQTVSTTRRRGRPRLLSVERVIEAAVEVVEAVGVDAMTIESVARKLGVGTMTVYGYVGSRNDLIDKAVASLLSQTPRVAQGRRGPWVEVVVEHCLAVRRWAVANPALFLLSAQRPRLSDPAAEIYGAEVDGLVRSGFTVEDAAVLRHAIGALLLGHVQWEAAMKRAETSGVRRGNRERVRKGEVPTRVATASALVSDADPEALYERSLRALLEGFERTRRRDRSQQKGRK
jgi:AcrR family transcriptional regulator